MIIVLSQILHKFVTKIVFINIKIRQMIKIGSTVVDRYGFTGLVVEEYENWEDLKSKNHFVIIDADNESEKMNNIEKLINGDPKDVWLDIQEIPFTEEQLIEKWYSVKCMLGGYSWSCESGLLDVGSN